GIGNFSYLNVLSYNFSRIPMNCTSRRSVRLVIIGITGILMRRARSAIPVNGGSIRAHRSAEDRESGRAGDCNRKHSRYHFVLHPPYIDISPPFFPPGGVLACRASSSFSLISSLILPSVSVYKIFIMASYANSSGKKQAASPFFHRGWPLLSYSSE